MVGLFFPSLAALLASLTLRRTLAAMALTIVDEPSSTSGKCLRLRTGRGGKTTTICGPVTMLEALKRKLDRMTSDEDKRAAIEAARMVAKRERGQARVACPAKPERVRKQPKLEGARMHPRHDPEYRPAGFVPLAVLRMVESGLVKVQHAGNNATARANGTEIWIDALD